MSTAPRKYTFVNGVLVKAPDSGTASTTTTTTISTTSTSHTVTPVVPIAVVCSPEDLASASEATAKHGVATTIPIATQNAIEGFYNPDFVNQYRAPSIVSGEDILEKLCSAFSSLEIPLGVLSKLLALAHYQLNFIVDDSGSMKLDSDSKRKDAGSYLLNRYRSFGADLHFPMSRWEEVEDRLHTMIDVIAYVPTGMISISFLNRVDFIYLDRTGKDPTAFSHFAHAEIARYFLVQPSGGTPIYGKLNHTFRSSMVPTLHYLFTDGEPSDARPDQVTELVLRRPNPMQNPITFISCTNDDAATGWMKRIDDIGPMIGEVDDYKDEKK